MTDVQKDDSQKTIVAFIVGLLIGGLLVWAFTGDAPQDRNEQNDDTPAGEEAGDDNDESSTSTASDNEGATSSNNATNTTGGSNFNLTANAFQVEVENAAAGTRLPITISAYPTAEGWVGVRDYRDGQQGLILGVARYSQTQGLIPSEVILQRATRAGNEYAIVFFNENGDRVFNAAQDTQLDIDAKTFRAE